MIELTYKDDHPDSLHFNRTIKISVPGWDLNETDMCELFTQFMHAISYNRKKEIYYLEPEECGE